MASNPTVGVVDRQNVRGTGGEGSAEEVGKPWRPRGMPDSNHWEEPEHIHFASGAWVVADPFAFEDVAHGTTWCALDPEKTEDSV